MYLLGEGSYVFGKKNFHIREILANFIVLLVVTKIQNGESEFVQVIHKSKNSAKI